MSLVLATAVGLLAGCGEQVVEAEAREAGLVTSAQHLDDVGSRGREFWLAFPGNHFSGTPELTLYIIGDTATTGQVQVAGFTTHFSVTPGVATPVILPASYQQSLWDGVEAKGIHVTAGADVAVYGSSRLQYSTDAFLGLPAQSLGTEYVVLAFPTPFSGGFPSQFSVVATEDGTTVTITPAMTLGSRPAGVPYDVTLNRGQAYQMATGAYSGVDVSGTVITSNRPVSVFGGNQVASIPNGNYAAGNYIVEQLPPASSWGRSFVTLPLATRLGGDTFRIVASMSGTQVRVNGTLVATLNRGQVHQRIISGAAHITSTQPILVGQYSNGMTYDGAQADPFMMLVPPHERFVTGYTVTTPASGFTAHYINVVVPTAAVGSLTLDGASVASNRFSPIGSTGFSGAQLAVGQGTHRLAAPLPFGAFVYGFGPYDAYGYPGGMSLSPVALASSVAVAPRTGTSLVNNPHCLTATVRDLNGNPLEGVGVDFAITGANAHAGQANTTAAGEARYCYTGTAAGSDAIRASVGTLADSASFVWTANVAPVANAGPDVTGYVDGAVMLSGSATDADGDALTYAWSYTAPAGITCTFGSPNAPGSAISCNGEGAVTVTLTARDALVSSSDTATVTLGMASNVTLYNLPRYTNQSTVNVCGWTTTGGSRAPVASAWLTVNGGAPIPVSPSVYDGFFWNPMELAEGTYVIRLNVVDTLGNASSRETTVTVDQTAPVLSFISPLPNDLQPNPVVDITFQVQDASPVTVVTGYSVTSQVPAGTSAVTQTVDFVNRGCNPLVISATDAAGNRTEYVSQVCVAY